VRNDGDVEIILVLATNDSARAYRYGEFALRFCVAIDSNLQIELEVHNSGKEPLIYEEAPHAYFAAGDVRQTCLRARMHIYIDKTDGFKPRTGQRGMPHRQPI
jgi:D-hexose-6-phosphate mutarotase